MKVKALVSVINADTGASVQVGEVFDLPDDRANVAIDYGYVEEVKETKKAKPKKAED